MRAGWLVAIVYKSKVNKINVRCNTRLFNAVFYGLHSYRQ